jgi:hypothetical protein
VRIRRHWPTLRLGHDESEVCLAVGRYGLAVDPYGLLMHPDQPPDDQPGEPAAVAPAHPDQPAGPNGDARMFLLVRDPSVPLPDASPTRPALPGTGQPDEHPSQVFATSSAGRNRMAAGIRQMIRDDSR